jgi:hypothetical protein
MAAAAISNIGRGGDRSKASIEALTSQTEAAEKLNVGRASVQRAKTVIDSGDEQLIEAPAALSSVRNIFRCVGLSVGLSVGQSASIEALSLAGLCGSMFDFAWRTDLGPNWPNVSNF